MVIYYFTKIRCNVQQLRFSIEIKRKTERVENTKPTMPIFIRFCEGHISNEVVTKFHFILVGNLPSQKECESAQNKR